MSQTPLTDALVEMDRPSMSHYKTYSRMVDLSRQLEHRALKAEIVMIELLPVATCELAHTYDGACPDRHDHEARDPNCKACQAIQLAEALLKGANPNACEWKEDADGNWDTECGECFCFADGTPTENKARFCPYCGKPIREKRYTFEQE